MGNRKVIEHHTCGSVYVDNIKEPRTFYIVHQSGMSLLCGDVDDDFLKMYFRDYLLDTHKERVNNEYLQLFPPELEERIDILLGDALYNGIHGNKKDVSDYSVVKYQRINFRFNPEKFNRYFTSLDLTGYTFQKVSEKLYYNFSGVVVPQEWWNDSGSFLKMGVGFSLICENKPVTVAFSAFRHDHLLELGMETKPKYRKRGFASITCAKLIQYCIEKNLEPVWSCHSRNTGSRNLALKLGFEPVLYLPYYEILYNKTR